MKKGVGQNFGVETAKKLGEFYFCKSTKDKWLEYKWRIVISVDDVEIYAQKCETETQIANNMSKLLKIYKELHELFQMLDSNKFGKKNDKILNKNNPIKLYIYKSL
jgi:hypothetical protein